VNNRCHGLVRLNSIFRWIGLRQVSVLGIACGSGAGSGAKPRSVFRSYGGLLPAHLRKGGDAPRGASQLERKTPSNWNAQGATTS